jgi:dUTP pyrophosphatase
MTALIPSHKHDGVEIGLAVTLRKNQIVVVRTGLKMAIPEGYKLCIVPRSGLAKRGVTVVNSPAQIDEDFRGELEVVLANLGNETIVIRDGERFAQCYLDEVIEIEWAPTDQLDETERGTGGFGSTGSR